MDEPRKIYAQITNTFDSCVSGEWSTIQEDQDIEYIRKDFVLQMLNEYEKYYRNKGLEEEHNRGTDMDRYGEAEEFAIKLKENIKSL